MSVESGGPPSDERAIDFKANPLVPAVITDWQTGDVLMVAFMNEEAYRQTRATGRTHFFSRSRNRLWKKGETSGHEQIVHRMAINCDQNSLLISVQQIGAVCHDGYPSCFYREIGDDESLTTIMDRWFDPAVVYGKQADPVRQWYGAYEYLRDQPRISRSNTSRILHGEEIVLRTRIAGELEELAGVLDGTHQHHSQTEDVLLEGSQSLYWLALVALLSGIRWAQLRADRALDSAVEGFSPLTAARLLRSEAERWKSESPQITSEQVHSAMALIAQAARSAGVEPLQLIARDLRELRKKGYLSGYFAQFEAENGHIKPDPFPLEAASDQP